MKWIFAAESPRVAARRGGLFVFLAVLLLAMPQAALLPLLDRDEPRFAEASREMLESGNDIVPTFNHAPRYAKPPAIYWAQAASFRLLGENAFTARLPSLLATALTALVLFVWGLELSGLGPGLMAALGYGLCFQTMQQGRVATADALLIFFVTLTAFTGWKMIAAARRAGYWKGSSPPRNWNGLGLLLAFALAGGFLAKGPEALLPILPIIGFARGGGLRFAFRFLALLALGLLLVAAWAIPAYVETNGDYWREGLGHDVGDRMVASFQGHGASSPGGYLLGLPFYLLLFWISALPWSPLLLIHGRRLLARGLGSGDSLYLAMNAGLFFVIFTFMVTKLPHYTLPAFPFLALLFAKLWTEAGLAPVGPLKGMLGFGLAFTLLAVIAIPVLMPWANPSPTGKLIREAGNTLTPATEFALVDFQEPNAIWEMRGVTHAYGQTVAKSDVLDFLDRPGPRAVILSSPAWGEISGGKIDPTWKIFTARGWNAARLGPLDLTLVVK